MTAHPGNLKNAGTELGNAIFGTLTASPVPEDMTEDISNDQGTGTKRSKNNSGDNETETEEVDEMYDPRE